MAEAFFGYLLPWGQMSYWGAQVIVNLFGAIPFIGPDLSLWIRGDYVVSDATLNRFFAFHVIAIPLVLLGLVVAHLIALHEVGSNNPDGVEVKENLGPDGHGVDTIPSHPYYTTKDIFGVSCFLFIFSAVVFYAPEFGGYFLEYNNFIPADPLKTPAHIAPVWYFTPFYSILRATTSQFMYALIIGVLAYGALIALKTQLPSRQKQAAMGIAVVTAILMLVFDAKFWGVVLMGVSVLIIALMPWIDHSPAKSIRYRPDWHKWVYIVFGISFLILGYLGVQAPTAGRTFLAQICTVIYFGFFMLMPWWSKMGEFKPVPTRVNFKPH
jgi:ubiquinol-cytochrome c reductase cytochrome b subunit